MSLAVGAFRKLKKLFWQLHLALILVWYLVSSALRTRMTARVRPVFSVYYNIFGWILLIAFIILLVFIVYFWLSLINWMIFDAHFSAQIIWLYRRLLVIIFVVKFCLLCCIFINVFVLFFMIDIVWANFLWFAIFGAVGNLTGQYLLGYLTDLIQLFWYWQSQGTFKSDYFLKTVHFFRSTLLIFIFNGIFIVSKDKFNFLFI